MYIARDIKRVVMYNLYDIRLTCNWRNVHIQSTYHVLRFLFHHSYSLLLVINSFLYSSLRLTQLTTKAGQLTGLALVVHEKVHVHANKQQHVRVCTCTSS